MRMPCLRRAHRCAYDFSCCHLVALSSYTWFLWCTPLYRYRESGIFYWSWVWNKGVNMYVEFALYRPGRALLLPSRYICLYHFFHRRDRLSLSATVQGFSWDSEVTSSSSLMWGKIFLYLILIGPYFCGIKLGCCCLDTFMVCDACSSGCFVNWDVLFLLCFYSNVLRVV